MSRFSLRARWIVTGVGEPLRDGVLTIDGERIAAVGNSGEGKVLELGDVVLLPGLINAHTHLEFSDCEKPLCRAATPLPEWIRQVIGMRHRSDRDARAAVAQGMRESLTSGVTTIGEISTLPASAYGEFHGSCLVAFQEVIGFSAGRIDSVYGELLRRLDSTAITAGISPHAPYTVHPDLLRRLVTLASERHLPVAMHLAESREELELLADGKGPFHQLLADRSMWDPAAIPTGARPLDYLQVLAEAPRALIIHGNYLDDEEIAFLAARRDHMSVVYCPRTHAYFGHDSYPLEKMLAACVRVALGTDSKASNPDLSMLNEMRYVARKYSIVPPRCILSMATLRSAEALGMLDLGTLEAGKLADVVAIPCSATVDPIEEILHSDAEPSHVFVRGKLTSL